MSSSDMLRRDAWHVKSAAASGAEKPRRIDRRRRRHYDATLEIERHRNPAASRLGRAIPIVFVADVRASAAYYRDSLGFSIDFLHGEPPFYGSVSRDGACLHVKFVHAPVFSVGPDDRDRFISVFVDVDNVDALFAEYVASGVTITQRLQTEDWGGRDFIVRDPDGNMICFAGREGGS